VQSTSPSPAPNCPPAVLDTLLSLLSVNDSAGSSGGLLGLLGILGPVVPTLSGTTTQAGLLDEVTGLLGGLPVVGGLVGTSTPAMASACTAALATLMPSAAGTP
jgi:hypothetical protein